jgi:hypothetical protein
MLRTKKSDIEIKAACADAVAEKLAAYVRHGKVPATKALAEIMDLMEDFGFVFFSVELVPQPAASGSVH